MGDNTEFTDYNTQCCPKIRLRGWVKASHCTLVINCIQYITNENDQTYKNVYHEYY